MSFSGVIQQIFRNYLGRQFDISKIEPGVGPIDDRYSYQKTRVEFGIRPDDKVLDIGSGQHPFPLATQLADFYPGETSHRQSVELVRDERPFTKADIEALPFRDNEFDFIYASHVLEHVAHPGQACRELMRVARRGYIETPTRLSDAMLNYLHLPNHHRWHISLIDKTLIFIEYTEREKQHDMGTNFFFSELHAEDHNPFQEMFHTNVDIFYNMLLWKDHFFFYVFDAHGNLLDTNREQS